MSAITQEALSRLLGDDFTDLRPLGESGGLSRLFRAHKVSLDVDVVIKRMKMDPRSDARREARILTSLRHQYLPRVYGFETDAEGYCYTVMELIPGWQEELETEQWLPSCRIVNVVVEDAPLDGNE